MNLFSEKNNEITELAGQVLSEKLGENVIIESSETLGGGCINHASKLETNKGAFFLKWNSNCAHDIFLREAEGLQELKKAAQNKIAIPEVFAAKEVGDTPGFLVTEYLKPGYSTGNDDELLGHGLATIHNYKNEKFGFYNNNYCGATLQNNQWKTNWAEFFRENRLRFLLDLIQKERPLASNEISVFEKLLEKIQHLIPPDNYPVLIHGDLWSGNYMITEKGPALIDPATYYASNEMEMSIMTMFGGFSQRFFNAYNEIRPLEKDWRSRNKLYQLYHVLNHYYLFGGGYRSQALTIAKSYL
ncbi:MAG TPA: fructosamine kinase family protein [Prolixibacteraceae bacterium]|nr:fructosamine kinase family protein [Prolixibacteraceae bacterium]